MQSPLDELTKLSRQCDEVSMLAMDSADFQKFFAKTYGIINQPSADNHVAHGIDLQAESVRIVETACQLLETAIRHHRGNSAAAATETSVKIFEATVLLLMKMLNERLHMNETEYQKARSTKLKLAALEACGFSRPDFPLRTYCRSWGDPEEARQQQEAKENEAKHYARENLEEFTKFVFETAKNGTWVQDPFAGEGYRILSLYEQVRFLNTRGALIESKSSEPNV